MKFLDDLNTQMCRTSKKRPYEAAFGQLPRTNSFPDMAKDESKRRMHWNL
jgi:hypothetical protein